MGRLFALLLVTALGFGCSSSNNSEDLLQSDVVNSTPTETDLFLSPDSRWVLESYGLESGEIITAAIDFPYTLQFMFNEQGTMVSVNNLLMSSK